MRAKETRLNLRAVGRTRPLALVLGLALLVLAGRTAFVPQNASAIGPSTTTITSLMNPAPVNQVVLLSVTVTCVPLSPTGIVSILDGATLLGIVPAAGIPFPFIWTFTTPGPHVLTATYSGDINCAPSAGTVTQQVGGGNTLGFSDTTFSPAPSGPAPYSGSGWDARCMFGCGPFGLP
jgi:hypothetical protein